MISEEKQKALEAALGNIEKQFGKGSVMKLGDSSSHMQVEAVPTGCLSLDIALGVGGVPKGRIVEIYGPESSGKTTVALHMVAEVQKRGGIAGFIDAEHALDPVYAKSIGRSFCTCVLPSATKALFFRDSRRRDLDSIPVPPVLPVPDSRRSLFSSVCLLLTDHIVRHLFGLIENIHEINTDDPD